MATIVTRAGKGSALTHNEMDANFTGLNTEVGGKANTASPTLTGTPAAPTAAVDTNTTQVATTAFVLGQAASANPAMNGTVAVGTSTRYARADHVHASDTSRAPLASPTFTGTPAAPTAATGVSTTQIATTAFVQQEIAVAPLVVSKTANATLALSDISGGFGIVEVDSASAVAITVPQNSSVAFPVGTTIEIVRIGTGAVTVVAGTNVIFQPAGTATISDQYKSVILRKRATNTWIIQ